MGTHMIQFTNQDPDFWIQLKGNNAGKPLRQKIPNSIGIKTDPVHLVPDFLFYTVLYLFQSGAFQPHIQGSVVPYITQNTIVQVIVNHWFAQHQNKTSEQGQIKHVS